MTHKNSVLLLLASILWFVSAAICVDLYYGYTSEGLMIMHILCALVSLLAAVVNLIRWKNSRHNE